MPPVTQALLIANVAIYFVVQQLVPELIGPFALWPWSSGLFEPWQVLSLSLIHISEPTRPY